MSGKPAAADLRLDAALLDWRRSGEGDGALEVAFVHLSRGAAAPAPQTRADWVLMRMAGDPDERVLVFDRNEWECFVDGARRGEFDDAAGPRPPGLRGGPPPGLSGGP